MKAKFVRYGSAVLCFSIITAFSACSNSVAVNNEKDYVALMDEAEARLEEADKNKAEAFELMKQAEVMLNEAEAKKTEAEADKIKAEGAIAENEKLLAQNETLKEENLKAQAELDKAKSEAQKVSENALNMQEKAKTVLEEADKNKAEADTLLQEAAIEKSMAEVERINYEKLVEEAKQDTSSKKAMEDANALMKEANEKKAEAEKLAKEAAAEKAKYEKLVDEATKNVANASGGNTAGSSANRTPQLTSKPVVDRDFAAMESTLASASTRGTGKNLLEKEGMWYSGAFNYQTEEGRKLAEMARAVGSVTDDGHYGFDSSFVDLMQKKVKTVSDVMAYFIFSGYSYNEFMGFSSFAKYGWDVQNDAYMLLSANNGVCINTATVVNFLLEGDYEETGTIFVQSNAGHAYNYVKADGVYYFVDFTDFTAESKYDYRYLSSDRMSRIDSWTKDKMAQICFWSGTSLTDPSATKAVLIHDTYERNNTRNNLSIEYNKSNTGAIFAIKYVPGMGGRTISFCTDYGNQSNLVTNGFQLGNYSGKFLLDQPYEVRFVEGTEATMLWANYTNKFCKNPWKQGQYVALKDVPYYCVVPEWWDKESKIDKYSRQLRTESGMEYGIYSSHEGYKVARFFDVYMNNKIRQKIERSGGMSAAEIIKLVNELTGVKIRVAE